jgi:hypothetical protein
VSELDDRRQRAREAGCDAVDPLGPGPNMHAVEAAIETATRVRITPEAIRAYVDTPGRIDVAMTAFLTALGFKVEQ